MNGPNLKHSRRATITNVGIKGGTREGTSPYDYSLQLGP